MKRWESTRVEKVFSEEEEEEEEEEEGEEEEGGGIIWKRGSILFELKSKHFHWLQNVEYPNVQMVCVH